jgi:hypothetical protein
MPHNAHQIGIEGVLALWELERLAARHHLLPITERERDVVVPGGEHIYLARTHIYEQLDAPL